MILVTSAANDRDMLSLLPKATIAHIPCDFMFWGKWEGGQPCVVAGERKKVAGFIQDVNDGRYIQQYETLRELGYQHLFLVLEGLYTSDRNELVATRKGKGWQEVQPPTEYWRLIRWLQELAWYLGVKVIETTGPKQTAARVWNLYQQFQVAPEDHTSFKKFYVPPTPDVGLGQRPSLVRRVAKELPGIGWERSLEVERRAKSVRDMVEWCQKDWEQLEGVGKVTARKVVEALNGPD